MQSKNIFICYFTAGKPGIVLTSIKSVTAQSVQINFVIPPNLGNGTLKKLSLSYASNKSPTKEAVLNSSLSTCEINGLSPYTDYIANITVQNEFFTSEGQMLTFKTSAAGALLLKYYQVYYLVLIKYLILVINLKIKF